MQGAFFAKFKYEYIVITITELRKRKVSRKEKAESLVMPKYFFAVNDASL
jgi:hypothetical protein